MLASIGQLVRRATGSRGTSDEIAVQWTRRGEHSRLARHLGRHSVRPPVGASCTVIESIAQETNRLGPQPLWSGYEGHNIGGATRMPDVVRTAASMGALYTSLVQALRPHVVVEFGTAFGVSGMYFLAGLEANQHGRLLTFEPNEVWRNAALRNLARIGDRFDSVLGTFEDRIDAVLPEGQRIDLAFIDAIHTPEFVQPQLELVVSRSADGAVIVIDDINFSGEMRACWQRIAEDGRFVSSAALGERVGILERA